MIRHRFAFTALCCALFCSNFTHFVVAEVTRTYRKPSATDLEWLLGDIPVKLAENSPVIVQTSYTSEKNDEFASSEDTGKPAKLPKPIRLPNPPIPPAPKAAHNKINPGLVEEEEGVMNITATIRDLHTSVVQMAGDRLPPPSEVPKEQEINVAVPLMEPMIEHLPVSSGQEHSLIFSEDTIVDFGRGSGGCVVDSFGTPRACSDFGVEFSPCVCLTCIACGDHRNTVYIGNDYCNLSDEEWLPQFDVPYAKNWGTICHTHAPAMLGSSAWLTGYYVETNGAAYTPDDETGKDRVTSAFTSKFTLPTMLLTRPNVVEHFNANVQNRIWVEYRHWNNVVSIRRSFVNVEMTEESTTFSSESTESRGVEQFTIGLEKLFTPRCSMEFRVPIIYQFGSKQFEETVASAEVGNLSFFLKQVMRQGPRWTLCGGIGTSVPTASSWQPYEHARLKNNALYLAAFLGAQWYPNHKTFGHFVVQADAPVRDNELFVEDAQTIKVGGQRVIRTGVQLGRWIFRADEGKRPCRLGLFGEVNYAVVTAGSPAKNLVFNTEDDSDSLYEKQEMCVSPFKSRQSTLTATIGVPMVFGKLTCMNSLILPVSGSDRPFSVGYNVSLSRCF